MVLWLALVAPVALALAAYLWLFEPQRLVVREVRVPIARLPEGWQGRRIVHLSDLHCRSRLRWGRPLSQLVAPLQPDVLLFTGDLPLRRGRDFRPAAAELAAMQAPLGRFWCPGNWDRRRRYPRHADVQAALAAAGWTELCNAGVELDGLWLAGLDDPTYGVPDAAAALAGAGGRPVVLMVHHSAPVPALAGYCDLALCGHTHGGQIVLPCIGYIAPDRQHRFAYLHGEYRLGRALLAVSAGLGTIFPHARLNCPPEIPVYILARGD